MNLYIYSDESGVLDCNNNDFYVFGGIITIGNEQRDEWSRRYKSIENIVSNKIRNRLGEDKAKNFGEIKASKILPDDRNTIFRSLNNCYKFGVIIKQQNIHEKIFKSKKDKQRYLDYAYKIVAKYAINNIINVECIKKETIENIFFYTDEHTTATNGRYELRECLEQELKNGTFNYNYNKFYPPILPDIKSINLEYCDSKKKTLVRAADIVANKLFYIANKNKTDEKIIRETDKINKMFVILLP